MAKQGPLVLVVDRGTGPWAIVAFVLGGIALVFEVFGAVTLTLACSERVGLPWWVSSIFLLVGIAFASAAIGVVRRIRGGNGSLDEVLTAMAFAQT